MSEAYRTDRRNKQDDRCEADESLYLEVVYLRIEARTSAFGRLASIRRIVPCRRHRRWKRFSDMLNVGEFAVGDIWRTLAAALEGNLTVQFFVLVLIAFLFPSSSAVASVCLYLCSLNLEKVYVLYLVYRADVLAADRCPNVVAPPTLGVCRRTWHVRYVLHNVSNTIMVRDE